MARSPEMVVERIVNTVFRSNTYLLHEDGRTDCWLVDIGDIEPVMSLLPDAARVKGVFLTHTHFDHIYGINALVERFPECLVFTSEHGKEGLYSDKLNCSRYGGIPFEYQGDNVRILNEGDSVELWSGGVMTAFETFGHDWSCLTYKIGDAVFSGDSYLPGIKVFTKFVKSDKEQAGASEQRILELSRGCVVYPGHGDVIEIK